MAQVLLVHPSRSRFWIIHQQVRTNRIRDSSELPPQHCQPGWLLRSDGDRCAFANAGWHRAPLFSVRNWIAGSPSVGQPCQPVQSTLVGQVVRTICPTANWSGNETLPARFSLILAFHDRRTDSRGYPTRSDSEQDIRAGPNLQPQNSVSLSASARVISALSKKKKGVQIRIELPLAKTGLRYHPPRFKLVTFSLKTLRAHFF